jgi:uncharacterized repeat protein (TIGR03809 family)
MELTDAARGRSIIERWCVLAEQRLDHLTELFETGRWRRYFGEVAFLDNIQEAKLAVETWRGLLNREATPDNLPVDLSWLGRRSTVPARRISFLEQEASELAAAPILVSVPKSNSLPGAQVVAVAQPVPDSHPPVDSIAPADPDLWHETLQESWQHALETDRLQQRYPLLRNAF